MVGFGETRVGLEVESNYKIGAEMEVELEGARDGGMGWDGIGEVKMGWRGTEKWSKSYLVVVEVEYGLS